MKKTKSRGSVNTKIRGRFGGRFTKRH